MLKCRLLLVLLILPFFFSCGDEGTTEVVPVITISPTNIMINDDQIGQVALTLVSGNQTSWTISSMPTWLNVSPSSGVLNTGQNIDLELTPNTSGFNQSKLSGVIEILYNQTETRTINVTVCINPKPSIDINFNSVELNDFNGFFANVELTNDGEGVLNVQPKSGNSNLLFEIFETRINEGQTVEGSIYTFSPQSFPIGESKETVFLEVDQLPDDLEIEVVITRTPNVSFFVDFFNTSFGLNRETLSVDFVNDGDVDINWEIVPLSSTTRISPSQSTGILPSGQRQSISFELDRTNLEEGFFFEEFEIRTQEGFVDFLFFEYIGFEETKTFFDGNVIDAEYSTASKQMHIIQEFPNALLSYEPESEEIEEIVLDFTPSDLNLSPDQGLALISGNSKMILVDLENQIVIGNIDNNASITDACVDNDGVIYVIENNRLKIFTNTGIAAEIDIPLQNIDQCRIHPKGKYLYATSHEDGLALKVDATDFNNLIVDTYQLMFPFFDFWFDENGEHLFTQNNEIYRITPDASSDFILDGNFTSSQILDMSFSNDLNLIAVSEGFIDEFTEDKFPQGGARFSANNLDRLNFIPAPLYLDTNAPDPFLNDGAIWHIGIHKPTLQYVLVSSSQDFMFDPQWSITKVAIE